MGTRFLARPLLGVILWRRPLAPGCQVLDDFPRSQHRPSLVHVGFTLPVICSMGKKQWNSRKANCNKISASTEKSISIITRYGIPADEAYSHFTRAMSKAAHSTLSRDFLSCTYPAWTTKHRRYWTSTNKKLSYRRGTARCVMSVEILPIATQQCRNYLYN